MVIEECNLPSKDRQQEHSEQVYSLQPSLQEASPIIICGSSAGGDINVGLQSKQTSRSERWHNSRAFSLENDLDRFKKNFVEREWLLDELEQWRDDDLESRVFWLTGDPGVGKSAAAAYFFRKGCVDVLHFCDARYPTRVNTLDFVRSIAAGLAHCWPPYRESLDNLPAEVEDETDPQKLWQQILAVPLSKMPEPGSPVLFLVDALDEAISDSEGIDIPHLLACEMHSLPSWARFVLTSRDHPDVQQLLPVCKRLKIEGEDQRNKGDIKLYLEQQLSGESLSSIVPSESREQIIEALQEKGEGNFLYCVWAVKELRQGGSLDPLHPEEFPTHFTGIYEHFFKRLFPKGKQYEQDRPILEVLCAAQEPLPVSLLTSITSTFIPAFLNDFFPACDDQLTPLHTSIIDWLTDEKNTSYGVRAENGHSRLAQHLLARWQENRMQFAKEGDSVVNGNSAEQYSIPVDHHTTNISRPLNSLENVYLLRHLPAHLAASKEQESLKNLLLDPLFLRTKNSEGMLEELIDDTSRIQDQEIELIGRTLSERARIFREAPEEFAAQMLEGLQVYKGRKPGIKRLCQTLEETEPPGPWLCPVGLSPPETHLFSLAFGLFSLAFGQGRDGQLLLAIAGKTVQIWDLKTGTRKHLLPSDTSRVISVAFGRDCSGQPLLATASKDGTVRIFDPDTEDESRVLRVEPAGKVKSGIAKLGINLDMVVSMTFGYGHDERPFLATIRMDGAVHIWDFLTEDDPIIFRPELAGKMEKVFAKSGINFIAVTSIAFGYGRDKQPLLATGSVNGTVRIWDLLTQEELRVLRLKPVSKTKRVYRKIGIYSVNIVTSIAFGYGRDKQPLLAATSMDGAVHIWDLLTEDEPIVFRPKPVGKKKLAVGKATILSSSTSSAMVTLTAFGYGRDKQPLLATASIDGTVQTWDPHTGTRKELLNSSTNWKTSVAFGHNHDGELLFATASNDKKICIWDPKTGTQRQLTGHTDSVTSVAFGRDSKGKLLLATASNDHTVRIWDSRVETQQREPIDHAGSVTSVAFGRDSKGELFLATGSVDSVVRIWNLDTGTQRRQLAGHTGSVTSVAFGRDSKGELLLATGSVDSVVRIWNPYTGKKLAAFHHLDDPIYACAFEPEAEQPYLITAGASGRLYRLVVKGL